MKVRHKKQLDRTELVEVLVGEFNLELEKIHPWHLRIKGNDKELDYFPQKGKATWVSSGKWFVIDNIEEFIENNFK